MVCDLDCRNGMMPIHFVRRCFFWCFWCWKESQEPKSSGASDGNLAVGARAPSAPPFTSVFVTANANPRNRKPWWEGGEWTALVRAGSRYDRGAGVCAIFAVVAFLVPVVVDYLRWPGLRVGRRQPLLFPDRATSPPFGVPDSRVFVCVRRNTGEGGGG